MFNVDGQDYRVGYVPVDIRHRHVRWQLQLARPDLDARQCTDHPRAAVLRILHGDNGAGLGANHQTGRTGVIARATHLFASTSADQVFELGKVPPSSTPT